MFRYLGGKCRLRKQLISIFETIGLKQHYCEPFVGAGWVIADVPCRYRFGYDTNKYTIALLRRAQEGPIELFDYDYAHIRDNKDEYPDWVVGLVGFGCSFGGKFFGGLARGRSCDYQIEAVKRINSRRHLIQDIIFNVRHYRSLTFKEPTFVYCDPPYAGTTGYGGTFDSNRFWDWAYGLPEYCTVVVSEFKAPDNWFCIWEKDRSLDVGSSVKTEKLFVRKEPNSEDLRYWLW